MRKNLHISLIAIVLSLFSCVSVVAQWISNPATNLMICDTTGEQALPLIKSTSDGGCYVSWFDSRNGSYAVYLQRLNFAGFKQFGNLGLPVSLNPQASSIVKYDLISDNQNNAVVVFSDIRNNGNLNPQIYKISPSGQFMWGNNGISLNPTGDYQPVPKVVQTTDGNYVTAWIIASTPYTLGMQKISSAGQIMWGNTPIILQGAAGEGFSRPYLVPSDSNCVILVHTLVTGNFPAQNVKIKAKKINANGQILWDMFLQDLGGIAAFSEINVASDGLNGAVVSWHDDRFHVNQSNAFIQRITSVGATMLIQNGIEVSLASGRNKFDPQGIYDVSTNSLYCFWHETNTDQNLNGIYGQRVNAAGERLWGNLAKPFVELSSNAILSISVSTGQNKAVVFFIDGNNSGINNSIKAFATNPNGDFVWTNQFTTVSNPTNEKLFLGVTKDPFFNYKVVWEDRRFDYAGIYAQDINSNGELGNSYLPVELINYSGNYKNGKIELNWTTATEQNNKGFEIERIIGSEVKLVGFVDGKGTTTFKSDYYFVDPLIDIEKITDKVTYSLKQIDFDGTLGFRKEIEFTIDELLSDFNLEQNFPNPFNPITSIKYDIPFESQVKITVYNSAGEIVGEIVNQMQPTGKFEVKFDASKLTSGVYYYQLEAVSASGQRSFRNIKKMLLLR